MNEPADPNFTIDYVESSRTGITLTIPSYAYDGNPRLLEDSNVFTHEGYLEGRAPEPLPWVDLSVLQNIYPRCLDMPLRLPGQTCYCLPEEWVGLAPILEQLISIEHAHNVNWVDYHTYMTVDCKNVTVGDQQRHGGLHVDGYQGVRITEKTKITRNYVMTTNGGTRFYPQPFKVADETKYNVFQGFDLQAETPIIAEENIPYFMDAYTVHESGFAARDGIRTFLRLTYDLKPFDRLGNTHNNMLHYDWEMVERNVHLTVETPTLKDLK